MYKVILLLACTLSMKVAMTEAPALLRIERQEDNSYRLMVKEKPFLVLGGETGNSTFREEVTPSACGSRERCHLLS